jgi:hypothetical protein
MRSAARCGKSFGSQTIRSIDLAGTVSDRGPPGNPRRSAADAKPTGATPRRVADLVGSAALAERVRTLTTQLAQALVEQTCALPAVGRWLAKGEIGMSKQSAWLLLLAGSLGGCALEASPALEEDEVAELADGLVKNALTPLQEAKVLKFIDVMCVV